jgi:hypothetical protein
MGGYLSTRRSITASQEGAWARLAARAALRPLKGLFPVALNSPPHDRYLAMAGARRSAFMG